MNPSDWNGSMEGDGEANAPVKVGTVLNPNEIGQHRLVCAMFTGIAAAGPAPARVGIIEEKSPRAGFSSRQYKPN